MSTVITAGTASNNGASISSDTSGNLSLVTGSSSQYTATIPQVNGTVLVGATPTSSVSSTVTNKISIVINGTTYYLLASTSAT